MIKITEEKVILERLKLPSLLLDLIDRSIIFKYKVLPIRLDGNKLILASDDPSQLDINDLGLMIKFKDVEIVTAFKCSIIDAIYLNYGIQ